MNINQEAPPWNYRPTRTNPPVLLILCPGVAVAAGDVRDHRNRHAHGGRDVGGRLADLHGKRPTDSPRLERPQFRRRHAALCLGVRGHILTVRHGGPGKLHPGNTARNGSGAAAHRRVWCPECMLFADAQVCVRPCGVRHGGYWLATPGAGIHGDDDRNRD